MLRIYPSFVATNRFRFLFVHFCVNTKSPPLIPTPPAIRHLRVRICSLIYFILWSQNDNGVICQIGNFPVPGGTISIYKNTVYKNIEAGIYQKIKNMLRIFKAEISKNVKNIEPQLKKLYSYKKKSVHV